MARIRHILIQNFRGIKRLEWFPRAGINCLIGPGDSGKSTVLDAIELCLTNRRSVSFADTDFHDLAIDHPIDIRISIGDLSESLKDLDYYGEYLRGCDVDLGLMHDEPKVGIETVLTVQLVVSDDLEPVWQLYSDRTATAEYKKSLPSRERAAISPSRIGSHPSSNLSWTRGSVLNKLSEERIGLGGELAAAAREARASFGGKAREQLAATLDIVSKTSKDLGVALSGEAQALLDAHAVSFNDGSVALHDGVGVPLRSLGTGSARLLLAGLHRQASAAAGIVLADEVEFGLEPHRLIRLLHSLGSKDKDATLQVFMTTHSPVAVRELSGDDLHILRRGSKRHKVKSVEFFQGTHGSIRLYPEAMLSHTVVVCEGASEVGLLRGLDLAFVEQGNASLQAAGASLVDAKGGSPDKCLQRALQFRELGYSVIAFIDNDKDPSQKDMDAFIDAGGHIATWDEGMALEDVLFQMSPSGAVDELLDRAAELVGVPYMEENLRLSGARETSIEDIRVDRSLNGDYTEAQRKCLGVAARWNGKKASRGWFKSISRMEDVARDILGPNWANCPREFTKVVNDIFLRCHSDV